MNKEIPMKQFLFEEGQRLKLNWNSVWYRIKAGKYPQLRIRRVNKRVVFVRR